MFEIQLLRQESLCMSFIKVRHLPRHSKIFAVYFLDNLKLKYKSEKKSFSLV